MYFVCISQTNIQVFHQQRFQNLKFFKAPKCSISDILRCHNYTYVNNIINECKNISPGRVGELDGDTIISQGSWEASLRAAGAGKPTPRGFSWVIIIIRVIIRVDIP